MKQLSATKKESKSNQIKMEIALKNEKELLKLEIPELESVISQTQLELKRINTQSQIQILTHVDKIKEVIENLRNSPSALDLEFETTRGLMALDDEEKIKPN